MVCKAGTMTPEQIREEAAERVGKLLPTTLTGAGRVELANAALGDLPERLFAAEQARREDVDDANERTRELWDELRVDNQGDALCAIRAAQQRVTELERSSPMISDAQTALLAAVEVEKDYPEHTHGAMPPESYTLQAADQFLMWLRARRDIQ